jgi:diguanylate cyclase (GGDEF)-like protein
MGKLDTIIQENRSLKDELERVVGIVRENEAKQGGFRVVEYAFLLSNSLSEMIEKPLHYLTDIFDIDSAALFLNSDYLDFDRRSDEIGEQIFFHPEKVFKYFFLEKRPYYGNNTISLISEFKVAENIGSYLIAPIMEDNQVIGALALFSKDPERFDNGSSVDFIKELSIVVMVCLKKLYSTEVIYRQARTDFLTGTYNKMAMQELLEQHMSKYRRYKKGFYFLMLDIDNFKEINDKDGHLVGDKILVDLCGGFKENLRASDIIGRFGGDEFFFILPVSEQVDIQTVCKKLHDVSRNVFETYGYTGIAGISGGVACVPFDFANTPENVDVVRLADTRLYDSKKAGKGRFTGI